MSATAFSTNQPVIIQPREIRDRIPRFDVKVVETPNGDLYAICDEDWSQALSFCRTSMSLGSWFNSAQRWRFDPQAETVFLDVDDDSLQLIAESGHAVGDLWTYPHRAGERALSSSVWNRSEVAMATRMVNYRIEERLVDRFNAAAEGTHDGKKGASVEEIRKFMDRYATTYERKQAQRVSVAPDQ